MKLMSTLVTVAVAISGVFAAPATQVAILQNKKVASAAQCYALNACYGIFLGTGQAAQLLGDGTSSYQPCLPIAAVQAPLSLPGVGIGGAATSAFAKTFNGGWNDPPAVIDYCNDLFDAFFSANPGTGPGGIAIEAYARRWCFTCG